jgi:hypothetical protein
MRTDIFNKAVVWLKTAALLQNMGTAVLKQVG